VVLGQSPPAGSAGLNGPRVALLVSDDQGAEDATAAYVMPQIVGLTLGTAGARLATVGLHIASAAAPAVDVPAAPDGTDATAPDAAAVPVPAPVPVSTSAVITSQSPAAGHRVTRADAIRVTLAASGGGSASPGVIQ
jgi:beta-lactam-binding protein with PASTA domain